MRGLEEIIEKNRWLRMLWGMVAGFSLVTVIAIWVEILFPE